MDLGLYLGGMGDLVYSEEPLLPLEEGCGSSENVVWSVRCGFKARNHTKCCVQNTFIFQVSCEMLKLCIQ